MRLFARRTSITALACLPWLIAGGLCCTPACAHADGESASDLERYQVFRNDSIFFSQESPDTSTAGAVTALDSGRVIVRTMQMEPPREPTRILARVVTRPVSKDEVSVHDPWDRAGNVRLSRPGGPDIELVKFVTAYGGVTEHEVDVTHLAPLFRGACTFKGFVDTWVSPAWTMDFTLSFEYEERNARREPAWIEPLLYEENATAESLGRDGFAIAVDVPENAGRVVLHYLVSGHCTDGTDEDEFVSKDNVISVDGVVVERFKPWRADCRDFRDANPYTRRWSNGVWSSDYSRSGWCPGDSVPPVSLDLSDHLTPGSHVVGFNVEGVRPEGDDGHLGYWRISGYLVAWGDD